jgi:hypothetical protein
LAEVTYYVALPFVAADDGIAAGEPMECFNPNAAVMRAEALSRKEGHIGAVEFSRTGDPATGDFSDAMVIRKFGDVPVAAITVTSDLSGIGRLTRFCLSAPSRFAGLEEIDTNFRAIDPRQFTAPIGKARRRKQQEKFLEVKPHDRPFDCNFSAVLGNVQHTACASPRTVDSHHIGVISPLKYYALAIPSLLRSHGYGSRS